MREKLLACTSFLDGAWRGDSERYATAANGFAATLRRTSQSRARELLSFPPGAMIYRIEGNAEHVGRDESKLRRPKTNHADDSAIDSRQNPTFPAAFSQQDGRNDCKYAGYVVKPEHT